MTMTVEEARHPLQTDKLAQGVLGSPIVARLAYTWHGGSPRVVPMWFHWTGEDISHGRAAELAQDEGPRRAPAGCGQHRYRRVAVQVVDLARDGFCAGVRATVC